MFGRFEMRARLPHGQGIWPAFWLRHRNGAGTAEVDVMEYFHSTMPGQTTATLHLDGRKNLSKKSQFFETPTDDPGVAHLGGRHRARPGRHPVHLLARRRRLPLATSTPSTTGPTASTRTPPGTSP